MAGDPTVVSLIASATEIICALGLRDHLLGVSHECDYPPDVKGLPVLSVPNVDGQLPSEKIDRGVREILRDGLSVYRVCVEELERLKPDLIVTQDHCKVCAVSLQDVEDALRSVTLKDTRVCSLHPTRLEQVKRDFRRVAGAAGVAGRGEELVRSFGAKLTAVRRAVEGLARAPRVACIEWLEPPMVAGGWMPELVRIAGGEPVMVESAEAFKAVAWADLAAADPDVVVLMPCGFPIAHTQAELENPEIQEAVRTLRATAEDQCYVVDGNAYFNRPGPRLADSAEILAGLFHGRRGAPYRARYVDVAIRWH